MEVDHLIPIRRGGTNAIHNLQLLHRHCHDVKTARETDPSKRYV
jgi:RNA-directed DNA polymerase